MLSLLLSLVLATDASSDVVLCTRNYDCYANPISNNAGNLWCYQGDVSSSCSDRWQSPYFDHAACFDADYQHVCLGRSAGRNFSRLAPHMAQRPHSAHSVLTYCTSPLLVHARASASSCRIDAAEIQPFDLNSEAYIFCERDEYCCCDDEENCRCNSVNEEAAWLWLIAFGVPMFVTSCMFLYSLIKDDERSAKSIAIWSFIFLLGIGLAVLGAGYVGGTKLKCSGGDLYSRQFVDFIPSTSYCNSSALPTPTSINTLVTSTATPTPTPTPSPTA
jgi:hypothetical protein